MKLAEIQRIINIFSDPTVIVNSEGKIVLANNAFSSFVQHPLASLEDQAVTAVLNCPEAEIKMALLKVFETGMDQLADCILKKYQDHANEKITFSLIESPPSGYALIHFRDMTEANLIRSNLEESEERFARMANSSPVLLWMSREDSLCIFFNQTWLDFTGRTLEEEWGVGWSENVHPADFQECMDIYQNAFSQREPFEMTYRLLRHDHVYRWILDRGVPRFTSNGRFAGFIGSCIDITERVETEKELEKRNTQLHAMNLELEQFSHIAAHDLREPARRLAAIADVFLKEYTRDVPSHGHEALKYIKIEAANMVSLIADFRFLTKLGHHEQPQKSTVNLRSLIEAVVEEFKDTAEQKQATFRIDPHYDVCAFRSLLYSLYRNLVSNALKHGSTGTEITFTYEQDKEEVVLGVKNSGSYIHPKFMSQIFVPFKRLSAKQSGSGLGLYICKKVVDAHDGKIWVENGDNELHFRFTLPCTALHSLIDHSEITRQVRNV